LLGVPRSIFTQMMRQADARFEDRKSWKRASPILHSLN
jgi:hypothetical protein